MSVDAENETVISHIKALRSCLIRCLVSLGVVLPFCFLFSNKALDFLIKIIISDNKITLNYFSPVEVFIIQIKMAAVLSVLICFPYIAKQIWDFILPALYDNEKRFIKSTVFASSFLFILGVLFCLFIIVPLVVNFGLSFSGDKIQPVFGVSNLITLVLWLSLAFGVMFQMPVITYFLIKSEFVEYKTLADKRPYVVVILLVASAVLTPPDVVSQITLALPTYLLFELGLFVSKLSCKPKREWINEQ